MKIKNDPSSWKPQLAFGFLLCSLVGGSLPVDTMLELVSALIFANIVGIAVSIAVSSLITSWIKEGIVSLLPYVDWKSYCDEPRTPEIVGDSIRSKWYSPEEVPRYGPWCAIFGLGVLVGYLVSIATGWALIYSLIKALIVSTVISLPVAGFSGFSTFVWGHYTRNKLLRHADMEAYERGRELS